MNKSQRYIRQLQLPGFGPEAQQKLKDARVLVVGAGGLGAPALQYLAGMGVGTLGIADGDVIRFSNLHRQVLYSEHETGKLKAQVAAAKLAALNSDIAIQVFPYFITPENALELLKNFDLVIDATDNFEARYLINDACLILNKPFIYGALHRFEGQVSVFNFENGPTYRCLYPAPPAAAEIPDCNSGGILGVVPGLVGCRQALEAVKLITGIGTSLSGCLMLFDFLNNTQFKIKLRALPENRNIENLQTSYRLPVCETCELLEPARLSNWYETGESFTIIDVRTPEEFNAFHLKTAQLVSLDQLEKNSIGLPENLPVVVVCSKGVRSQKAAAFITGNQPKARVYSLAGGMEAWLQFTRAAAAK